MDLMQMNLTRTKRLKMLAIGKLPLFYYFYFSKQRAGSNYNIDMQIGRWGGGGVILIRLCILFVNVLHFFSLSQSS